MDEDISAINTSTRIEKLKNFFIENKKSIIIFFSVFIIIIIGYFAYDEINKRSKIKIANQFESSKIDFISGNAANVKSEMINIIKKKDNTYSPLALYFLLDNEIITSPEKINEFYDILINDLNLETENKNLIIYKKALFNFSFESENNLIKMLNPIINSDSIWKSHSLYLLGEFFLSKNEKQKSKEFFEKILVLDNSNTKIKIEAQKRIERDLSD
tara:strand:- start:5639 stop:6283 length:645 start_codon:yes stop_codon:yes gene_type:complete